MLPAAAATRTALGCHIIPSSFLRSCPAQLWPPCDVQVDLIDLNGPLYTGFDNRLAALRLVQKGLCDAALFDPSGLLNNMQLRALHLLP